MEQAEKEMNFKEAIDLMIKGVTLSGIPIAVYRYASTGKVDANSSGEIVMTIFLSITFLLPGAIGLLAIWRSLLQIFLIIRHRFDPDSTPSWRMIYWLVGVVVSFGFLFSMLNVIPLVGGDA